MLSPVPASRLTRRRLLALGGGLGLGGLTGCTAEPSESGLSEQTRCVSRDTLERHRSLAGAPLLYEVNGQRSNFWFDPGFFTQLEAWANTLPGALGQSPTRWRTYGSWTDGGAACDSWHNAGRAFDLAGLQLRDGSRVSCRYDQWRDAKAATVEQSRRAYWIVAAGLHRRFAYVLTYLYNAQHANHIHVDNGRSGSEPSRFSTRSRVQVQAVQAISSYLWQQPIELTGRWDSATRRASRRVLDGLGRSGDIDDDAANWQSFLDASAALPRE